MKNTIQKKRSLTAGQLTFPCGRVDGSTSGACWHSSSTMRFTRRWPHADRCHEDADGEPDRDSGGRWRPGARFFAAELDAFYTLSTGLASLATLAIVVVYVCVTLGGRRQATLGMRAVGLRLERLDNGKITGRYGIAHLLLFLATFTVFTPLILLAPFVLSNRQMLHDRLLDIVIQGSAENLLPAAKR
ncbi:RDD family protein [Nitratireductor aquibiodomus]|uniref:RDD family protein n=1 Tax=Nitratireductor aquibiodomus TaxID=204799 RepID=UPI0012DFB256|nr:RDD family protein [Nitratireductor aquibiodomus]